MFSTCENWRNSNRRFRQKFNRIGFSASVGFSRLRERRHYSPSRALCLGLIKNHPWQGGNKRTATFLTNLFLKRNGYKIIAPIGEIVEMVPAVESDRWKVNEIEIWLRRRVKKI
ncbi:MAG: type II toxin-antitoxin system death-on-curing family toxin [Pyrinomonadaceae bacterium]